MRMRVSSMCVVAGLAAFAILSAAACSNHPTELGAKVGRPKHALDAGQDAGRDGGESNHGSHAGDRDEDGGAVAGGDFGDLFGDDDAGRDETPPPPPPDAGAWYVEDAGAGTTPPVMLPVLDVTYDGPEPLAENLPKPKGECPVFAGTGEYTFNVQGGRVVFIGVDATKAPKSGPGGPVIFYWHGTGGHPFEAGYGLGDAVMNAVVNQGGLIAGFYSTMNWPDKGACDECRSNTGNGVWFTEDFNLADEVLACAIEQLHVDTRRLHASGMSAGGLQTTAMLYARSNYMASVAPYSGGTLFSRTRQDPDNDVAAMIFHGTYDDDVVGIHFYSTSKTFFNDITSRGGFAVDCNHGGGHVIPADGGPAVWAFFQTHPYKTAPSPWATTLPSYLPSYCSLTFQ